MRFVLVLLALLSLSRAWAGRPCLNGDDPYKDFADLNKHFDGEWFAATPSDIRGAPCKQGSPPSESSMLEFIGRNPSKRLKNAVINGVAFKNEDPKLLKLFQDLHQGEFWQNGSGIKFKSKCDKVECAMKEIYGAREGVQLLYMQDKYGYSGADKGVTNYSRWRASELDDVLVMLSDYPATFFPIKNSKTFAHFKRGYMRPGGENTIANAMIEVFDSWNELPREERQSALLHEIGHNLGSLGNKDKSREWLGLSDWTKKTVVTGKTQDTVWTLGAPKAVTSKYGGTNPAEDFAETVVAYRYNGARLKIENEGKYNYMKTKVFDGIEYDSSQNCRRGTATQQKIAKLNDYIRQLPSSKLNDPQKLIENGEVMAGLMDACRVEILASLGAPVSGVTETCVRQKLTGVFLSKDLSSKALANDTKVFDSKDLVQFKFSDESVNAAANALKAGVGNEMIIALGLEKGEEGFKKALGVSRASSEFCDKVSQYMYQDIEKSPQFSSIIKSDQFFFYTNRKKIEEWGRSVCASAKAARGATVMGFAREKGALQKAIAESIQ